MMVMPVMAMRVTVVMAVIKTVLMIVKVIMIIMFMFMLVSGVLPFTACMGMFGIIRLLNIAHQNLPQFGSPDDKLQPSKLIV
jgi:hypothetical protein